MDHYRETLGESARSARLEHDQLRLSLPGSRGRRLQRQPRALSKTPLRRHRARPALRTQSARARPHALGPPGPPRNSDRRRNDRAALQRRRARRRLTHLQRFTYGTIASHSPDFGIEIVVDEGVSPEERDTQLVVLRAKIIEELSGSLIDDSK